MTTSSPTARRAGSFVGMDEVDAALHRAVHRTSLMRQCFYLIVLTVALTGQVSGAVTTLHIRLVWAIPAVTALELGGVVVFASADVRRRLGERAIASRLLSMVVAGWAVAFNWLAHADHLLGAFFSGMSALGYLVWLMHAENQRRDRLRATGDLPPTTPAYEILAHWLRHPCVTQQARSLAKADPSLDLYTSLAAARAQIDRERRHRAISAVLHRKICSAVDADTADIALAVYDLDEIAARLADQADYAALTALISADLAPARLAAVTDTEHGGDHDHDGAPGQVDAEPDRSVPTLLTKVPARPPSLDVSTKVIPTATTRSIADPAIIGPESLAYEPTGEEDTVMYAAWRRAVVLGREPSGADLARAAGRPDDATGAGRRAARRYREAHKNDPGPASER